MMTDEEIARSYRLAADPWSQISVLAGEFCREGYVVLGLKGVRE